MVLTSDLKLINKLRSVALNLGKALLISSKIKKCSRSVILDIGLFLSQEAITDSVSCLLKEGPWAVGITLPLFRDNSLKLYFD